MLETSSSWNSYGNFFRNFFYKFLEELFEELNNGFWKDFILAPFQNCFYDSGKNFIKDQIHLPNA